MSSDSEEDEFFSSFNADIERRREIKAKRTYFKDLRLAETVVQPRLFSRQEEAFMVTRLAKETRPRYIENRGKDSKGNTLCKTNSSNDISEECKSSNDPPRKRLDRKKQIENTKRNSITTDELAALVASLRLTKSKTKR